MPHSSITPLARRTAQALRRRPTDAEAVLWRELRGLKRLGYHFRRQTPVGPYIADFACLTRRVVVEVDGGQHADARLTHDDARTKWLRGEGFRVVRFWNHDVLADPSVVAGALLDMLEAER